MTTERIAGIKVNFDRLSDQQLTTLVQTQQKRVEIAQMDLQKAAGYAMMRGLITPDIVFGGDYGTNTL